MLEDVKRNGDATVYFVRHAKDNGRYRGGWSKRPLVREGEQQAGRLAVFIQQHQEEMCVRSIITSDLQRGFQTAQPIADMLKLPMQKSMEWRETNNGRLAGMLHTEAERRYPGVYWSTLDMEERYPGGESTREFYHRIKNALEGLQKAVAEGRVPANVLVITHSGVINVLYSIICGEEWSNKKRSFNIPHASIHEYNMEKNQIRKFVV